MANIRPEIYRPADLPLFDVARLKSAYAAEYERLYIKEGPHRDVNGKLVIFEKDRWKHICQKEVTSDPFSYGQREAWRQDRADRVGWSLNVIKAPDEIWKGRDQRIFIYMCEYREDRIHNLKREYFVVVCKKATNGGSVIFRTGYSMDKDGWRNTERNCAERVYANSDE